MTSILSTFAKPFLLLLFLSVILVLGSSASTDTLIDPSSSHSQQLEHFKKWLENESETIEMDLEILKEMLLLRPEMSEMKPESLEMRRMFAEYKEKWVKEMVDYVIENLGISEEKAQYVRAQPEKYHIDFFTYKMIKGM